MMKVSDMCLLEMKGKVKGAVIEGVWRRAAGVLVKIRWVGISFICVEFGFHFKTP